MTSDPSTPHPLTPYLVLPGNARDEGLKTVNDGYIRLHTVTYVYTRSQAMKTELNQKIMELKLRKEELKKQTAEAARIKKMVSVYQKKVGPASAVTAVNVTAVNALGWHLGPHRDPVVVVLQRVHRTEATRRAHVLLVRCLCYSSLATLATCHSPRSCRRARTSPFKPVQTLPIHPPSTLVPLHSFTGGTGDGLEVAG